MALMGLNTPVFTQQMIAAGTVATASSDSGIQYLNDTAFSNALIELNVTAVSGTSPTLDVYVQESLDGGTTFKDMCHFTQITAATTNPVYAKLAIGGDMGIIGAVGDATIASGALGAALVSKIWKVKYVIGGTTPSFTFGVKVYLA